MLRNVLILLLAAGFGLALWDLLDSDGWHGTPEGLTVMAISALLLVVLRLSNKKDAER